jgi:hypothetical protein
MCAVQKLKGVELLGRGGDAEMEALFAALSDARPRVAREACRALAERFVVPRERVWRLLVTARFAHTRLRAVRLLARGERGESMVWLLCAAALGDADVRDEACRHLADWATYWAPVTPERLADLTGAMRLAAPALPVALREELWAYVRSMGGVAPTAPTVEPQRPTRQGLCDARDVSPRQTPPKPKACVARPKRAPATAWQERVVRRRYELPPRWRMPWRWVFPK